MRAAALCAAKSRATQQVFEARTNQLNDSVYCCKKEHSTSLSMRSCASLSNVRAQARSVSHALATSLTHLETPSPPASRCRTAATPARTRHPHTRLPAVHSGLAVLRAALLAELRLSCLQLP